MSKVNRNSHKVRNYTNKTQESSINTMERYLSFLQMQLDSFDMENESPALTKFMREVRDHIKNCLVDVRHLKDINNRLGEESRALIAAAPEVDLMNINTDPVEDGLRGALLEVDNFHTVATQYVDLNVLDIKEKIIQTSLVEFRNRVMAKLNALNLERQQLSQSSGEDKDQANQQKMAAIEAKIERLNRCMDALTIYEKRLSVACLQLEEAKNVAYSCVSQIRKIYSNADEKIKQIKHAVNH